MNSTQGKVIITRKLHVNIFAPNGNKVSTSLFYLLMDKFEIRANGAGEVYCFEVRLPVLSAWPACRRFEPGEEEYLHICGNPGGPGEEVIYQIGLKIEVHIF